MTSHGSAVRGQTIRQPQGESREPKVGWQEAEEAEEADRAVKKLLPSFILIHPLTGAHFHIVTINILIAGTSAAWTAGRPPWQCPWQCPWRPTAAIGLMAGAT